MVYVTNAFSLNMLTGAGDNLRLAVSRSSAFAVADDQCSGRIYPDSIAFGHQDIADLAMSMVEPLVPDWPGPRWTARRVTLSLQPGDIVHVAQYTGPRLPEGTTVLPEGAEIQWWKVLVFEGKTMPPNYWLDLADATQRARSLESRLQQHAERISDV